MSDPMKTVQATVTTTVTEGWFDRVADFLISVAASSPDDHPWVKEARWLLENGPDCVTEEKENDNG